MRTAILQAEPCFVLAPVLCWTGYDLFPATWDKPALALPCAKFLSGAQLVLRWYLYQAGKLGVRARRPPHLFEKVRNAGSGAQEAGRGKRVRGARCRVQGAGCRVEHVFALLNCRYTSNIQGTAQGADPFLVPSHASSIYMVVSPSSVKIQRLLVLVTDLDRSI